MTDIELASSIIGNLRKFFDGTEYIEDALQIAHIVCRPGESNDHAKGLIVAVGYVLGIVLDWKEASPETIAKVKAIRLIALPGYYR
jgi:hypothetical protein